MPMDRIYWEHRCSSRDWYKAIPWMIIRLVTLQAKEVVLMVSVYTGTSKCKYLVQKGVCKHANE